MVGFMAKAHPELVLAVKRAGHVIGNHSYDHPNFLKLSDTKRRSEIKKTNELLREITGTTPKCFRPPYGRKSEAIRKIAAEEGLATVIWDDQATFKDPDNAKSEAKWIVDHAHPGSVILLHDADGWGRRTKESLVAIIEGLQKKRLEFDTICE
jgi:peptidoglycan/xylan/chitin deacetylase (PgdA/CDA1 family)